MPLFEVDQDAKKVTEIQPATFPGLHLWERQDLEAWVVSAPKLAGGDGFTVVTSEFAGFDQTSERLDVLGIVQTEPGHGRLVVIELKRDGTSTTADLQAIKYAAYVATAQFSDVIEMYARHHKVDEEAARAKLLGLLGGTEEEPPIIDDVPRIVLVASDFRIEVTTTVLWLTDNFERMDIRCVRLEPFAVGERVLVHSEVVIPLPVPESYRLGVQRKRRQALERAGRHIDRDALREVCESIPPGHWATYGDVARAIGVPGAAQSVAGIIATDESIPNAHRVLRSTGKISPGWAATNGEGGPEVAAARLAGEDLAFAANGTADPSRRFALPTDVPAS